MIQIKYDGELPEGLEEKIIETFGGEDAKEDKIFTQVAEHIWVDSAGDTAYVIGWCEGACTDKEHFGYRYFKIGDNWHFSYDYVEGRA